MGHEQFLKEIVKWNEIDRMEELRRKACEPSDAVLTTMGITEEINELRRLLAEEDAIERCGGCPPKTQFDKFIDDRKKLGQALWDKGGHEMLRFVIATFVPRAQRGVLERGFNGVGRTNDV